MVRINPDPVEDLKRSIEWCHAQADGNLRAIGIQIGSRFDLKDEPLLEALVRRGAAVYPDTRGKNCPPADGTSLG